MQFVFSEQIESKHLQIDENNWDTIYVIGDVHAAATELNEFIDHLNISNDDLIIFVGDLIRKGPHSKQVLEYVMKHENMLSIRGNNEQKILDGEETINTFTQKHIDYIQSLPLIISWNNSAGNTNNIDNAVIHGGINHTKPLEEHTPEDLLNMRSLTDSDDSYERPLWFETRTTTPRIFFGHTVLSEPFETEYAVGLDTGAVNGRKLTAYNCTTNEFETYNVKTTHVPRSEDAIVTPKKNF